MLDYGIQVSFDANTLSRLQDLDEPRPFFPLPLNIYPKLHKPHALQYDTKRLSSLVPTHSPERSPFPQSNPSIHSYPPCGKRKKCSPNPKNPSQTSPLALNPRRYRYRSTSRTHDRGRAHACRNPPQTRPTTTTQATRTSCESNMHSRNRNRNRNRSSTKDRNRTEYLDGCPCRESSSATSNNPPALRRSASLRCCRSGTAVS